MRGRDFVSILLCIFPLAGVSAGAEPPTREGLAEIELALGVAPFETRGPPGVAAPDVAALLAARLVADGVRRVVGPDDLAGPGATDGLDGVVRGRTTRLGEAMSLDVRLQDRNGEFVATFVEEVAGPEALDGAVVGLAARIVIGALQLGAESEKRVSATAPSVAASPPAAAEPSVAASPPAAAEPSVAASPPAAAEPSVAASPPAAAEPSVAASPPAAAEPSVAASPPAATAPEAGGGAPGEGSFGFSDWQTDGPLSIQSEELEAVQKQGTRTLIFRKNVRVQQGELSMQCERLEAYYPAQANQPTRLVATGKVHLVQGTQDAWCDETLYDRRAETLVCRGNARFRDGDNTLRGREIHIDLAKETVNVMGGAEVIIQPEASSMGES
ncbi:MAG TPA: LptA/OstA family protein [Myxococcota bacterium]|jgi:lipopolysaccharide transport protein LptA|nr:LptA/OstA family protein [Myxococcota bacterium]